MGSLCRATAFALGAVVGVVGCAGILGVDHDYGLADDGGATSGDDGAGSDAKSDSNVKHDSSVDVGDGCSASEDCTNGIDDNCDGLVDCADPLCKAGYTCTPNPPNGWSGPVVLFDGAGNATPPACASPYGGAAIDGHWGMSAPSPQCGCTCGPSQGEGCGSTNVSLYSNAFCTNQYFCFNLAITSSCTNAPSTCVASNGGGYMDAPTFSSSGGSCPPQPTKVVPQVLWGHTDRACGYSGPNDPGGCAAQSACVARPPQGFGSTLCVYASGDLACPSEYPTKNTYYKGLSDTRDCSQCSCVGPSGGTCNGSVTVYNSTSCSGGTSSVPLGSTCAWTAIKPLSFAGTFQLLPGSCSAQGGQPQGAAAETDPTTVCCAP
jgi:hypothetical protein